MSNIYDELKAIEEIAQSPDFAWEDEENILSYADDLFYDDEEFHFSGAGVKSPSGTCYGLRIVNNQANSTNVILFGQAGIGYLKLPPEQRGNIDAHSGYPSYEYLLEYLKSNPAEITSIRIQSTEAQINQMAYKYVETGAWGGKKENVVSIATFRTEKDYLTGTITVPVSHKLDIATHVEFTLLANTTIDMIYFIGLRRVISRPISQRPSRPTLIGKAGRIPIQRPSPRPIIRPSKGGAI